jgi:hypothetical protein
VIVLVLAIQLVLEREWGTLAGLVLIIFMFALAERMKRGLAQPERPSASSDLELQTSDQGRSGPEPSA